mgnify:CR=1 FL=1
MGIPYNFLQELSGVGRTIAPPEFDDSSRYIGTIQQFNYFYASESGTLTLNLNSFEKGNVSNERMINSVDLNNFLYQRMPTETGSLKLTIKDSFFQTNLETGNLSSSLSGISTHFPLETGIISINFYPNFISGINEYYDLNFNFASNFSEINRDDGSIFLTLESFIKKIQKEYSSLELILNTGEYRGGSLLEQNDYGDLELIIYTGSYAGPE